MIEFRTIFRDAVDDLAALPWSGIDVAGLACIAATAVFFPSWTPMVVLLAVALTTREPETHGGGPA